MKQIIGFFMAWGCFSTIPCPYKKWSEASRNWMLAMLPFVGLIIGGLNVALYKIGELADFPQIIMAALLTAVPFVLSGFIHLDGFMDCNDAILSRRDLAERQRILKDSNVGAFAVIMTILLFMFAFAGSYGLLETGQMARIIILGFLPYVTRAIAVTEVFYSKPMGTSQYAKSYLAEEKRFCAKISTVVHSLVILGVMVLMIILKVDVRVVLTIPVVIVGQFIGAAYGKKQLGGMNGDISGYSITWGELIGLVYLAVI